MVQKSKSENLLVDNNDAASKNKKKQRKLEDLPAKLSKINKVVKNLESSLIESGQHDRRLIMGAQKDSVKNQKLAYELEEARKDNKQLLNILQQQCSDQNQASKSTSRSQLDTASSYSTMSMVHLQYKYEELLASHEGLLKILESKIRESQKCYRENDDLRDDVQKRLIEISNHERTVETLCNKYLSLKQRKDKKIANLRYERDTLRLVHNQLVHLLHNKCMDEDRLLTVQLGKSNEPTRALLLNEIRLCNKLQHENARLHQENRILRSRLGMSDATKR